MGGTGVTAREIASFAYVILCVSHEDHLRLAR